jgi:hypothetical protein
MSRTHEPQSRRHMEGSQPPKRPDPKGGPLRPRPAFVPGNGLPSPSDEPGPLCGERPSGGGLPRMSRTHRPQSRRHMEGPQPPPRPDPKGGPFRPRHAFPRGQPSVFIGRTRPTARKTTFGRRTASSAKSPQASDQAPCGRAPDSPTARPQGGTLTAQTFLFPQERSAVLVGRARPIVRKRVLPTRTASHVKNPRTPEQAPHGRPPDSPTVRPQGGTPTAQTSLLPRARSSVLLGRAQPIVRNTAFGRNAISHVTNPRLPEQAPHGRVPDSPTVRPQAGTLTDQTSLFPRGRSSFLAG